MIKSELIVRLYARFPGLELNTVSQLTNGLLAKIATTLAEGKRIEIRDFGSFSLHYHPARLTHNPLSGKRMTTKPKYSPYFKASKKLKELVASSVEEASNILC